MSERSGYYDYGGGSTGKFKDLFVVQQTLARCDSVSVHYAQRFLSSQVTFARAPQSFDIFEAISRNGTPFDIIPSAANKGNGCIPAVVTRHLSTS